MCVLTRIRIYPFKSLDGQAVDAAVLLPSGGLQNDRRYALADRSGDHVNGKRFPALQRLRTRFDPRAELLSVRVTNESLQFDVNRQRTELADWFSQYLGERVTVLENPDGGFPDDTESPGPTIISTATLAEVGGWFGGLSVDEVRDRFRANLEIDAAEPFWEDRLVAENLGVVRLRIGEAELLGTNPCQRCPVPTRDPYSGEAWHGFAKTFAAHRQETLPEWAPASRFDHFYRLAVNTRPVQSRECTLRVGDELRILAAE